MSLSTVWPRRKVLTTIALGLMSLVVGKQAESEQAKSDEASVPTLVPPLFGDPLAPVRFCLWGNYTCGYTAQLFPILLNIALENRGKVSIEWHHFPQRRFDPALHVASLGFIATNRFWLFTRDFWESCQKAALVILKVWLLILKVLWYF